MELKRIKDLFTQNCNMGHCPTMPKFKKRGLIVWIMPWHWIVIPLLRYLKKKSAQTAIDNWKANLAKYNKELHAEYEKMVSNYLFAEHKGWDPQELEQMEAWAEQVESETRGEISKELMLMVYKSEIMKKAIKKSGNEISEMNLHAPTFVWGYDYKKGYIDSYGGSVVSSICDARMFFYTQKQIIIVYLSKDFYNNTEKLSDIGYFYRGVTSIKVDEDTVINDATKKEFTSTYIFLNASGDKCEFPVDGKNADAQVKCIKGVLNSRAE